MKETPQEYIRRITSYVEGEQPLKVQAATPKKLERLIKGVSVSKLRKRPAPDKWSVVETVEHIVRMFAGHDLNHIRQIEHILAPQE
jgi:hypothetical protein